MERLGREGARKGENEEISFVQAWKKDILPEEFPEGAYGASIYNDQHLGKSTPWKEGQQVVSRFKDENPAFSDFTVPEKDLPDF